MSDRTKPQLDLIPLAGLERIARIFEDGLKPQADREPRAEGDWQKMTKRDFQHARLRHLRLLQMGDTSEDHEAAVNACGLIIMWFESGLLLEQALDAANEEWLKEAGL